MLAGIGRIIENALSWDHWLPGHVIPDLGPAEPGRTCLRSVGWCDLEPVLGGWLIVRGANVFWPVIELRPLRAARAAPAR